MRTTAIAIMLCLFSGSLLAGPLEDGLSAFSARRYADAAAVLTPLARNGNPQAQVHVGLMHFYGLGVAESEATAFDWFTRSAIQGSPEGMFYLGNMYLYGNGVPTAQTDPDISAAQWFFRAARKGHAEAQYSLGLLFLVGKGVEKNEAQAMKWIRRAATQGHAAGQRFLGTMGEGQEKPSPR